MRVKSIGCAVAIVLAVALAGVRTASADVSLPNAHCGTTTGTNCLVFDNFTVYSLALLNFQAGQGAPSPGDTFYVSTNGMDLQNALVIGTGVSGQGSINTDQITDGGVDNAYQTPSAATGNLTNFATNQNVGAANSTQGAQGAAIPNNSPNTWDVNVKDLVSYLNGGQLSFFFNLNQTNSNQTSYLNNPEDALGWLSVTLTNSTLLSTEGAAACATDVNCSRTFYLDGNACNGVLGAPNSPNCDPTQAYVPNSFAGDNNNSNILTDQSSSHNEWAYIHGQICVSPAGGVVGFGACAQGDHVDTTVNQNLGATPAAFALYSGTLQQWLLSGDYDKMSVDFRMAAEDNGYEQLLILPVTIPEPLTVMLFGAGLIGMVAFGRRKLKLA